MGDGGVKLSGEKLYEGIRFNVISVTRGCVGVQFPGKKHFYITLEWPLCSYMFVAGFVVAHYQLFQNTLRACAAGHTVAPTKVHALLLAILHLP